MPDGNGGSSASALRDKTPAAEVFEARKQVGVGELHERVKKAVESSGGNAEEVVRSVMMLATEGADDIKNNLEKIRKTFDEDPEAPFRISISKELSDKIKDLEEGPRAAVEKAFAQFEESLRKTVKAALPEASRSEDPLEALEIRPGVDSSEAVSVIDKQMEDLQEKIEIEEKTEKLINSKRKFPASEKTVSKELGRLNEEMKALVAERTALLEKEAAEAAVPASTTTEKAVETPVAPVAAEAVKPLGISASFAEAARKIQEKNAAEAEVKLGGILDKLVVKAKDERTKMEGAGSMSEARFESDKPVLIARYLLRFLEGDKRTRRKKPEERWEKVMDAKGNVNDHAMEDLSRPDEFEEYIEAESTLSEAGVLNVARKKYGYVGEDARIIEAIRVKAGEELSNEKKAGTGDFVKGASEAKKNEAYREELNDVSEKLQLLKSEAKASEKNQQDVDRLSARRDELILALGGKPDLFAPKKPSADASVPVTPDAAPSTPDAKPSVEVFTDAERKEMGDKITSGEKILSEAEVTISALESPDLVSDEQKGEVEWVKGGYKTLIDTYRNLSDAKTVEEKTKARDGYETARAVIGDKAQREVIAGIRDGLAKALKETSAEALSTKNPEIQQQEKVLRNYAVALKSLLDGISEHVSEIGSIKVDVPELTIIAPEPTPDPAPSASADVPVTPDAPPAAPEALSAFEKIVAEDEARLTEVKTAMAEWSKGTGERPPQDADIQRVVDVYEAAIKAERAYIVATTQPERDTQWAQVRAADKAVPKARASLDKLTKDFLLYARKAEGPDGYAKETWGPAWKETILSRTAVLNVLSGMLKKIDQPAKASKPADAPPVVPSTPPDAPKDPVVTPDASSPDPDAAKPLDAAPVTPVDPDRPEYGPKTHVEHEEELLGRIDGLLDKMSERQDLDKGDAAVVFGDLGEVLIRAQEGMELLEEASRETDELKRQDLLVKRDVILRDPEILGKAEAYMKKMVESIRTTSPEDMQKDTEFATRIELFEVITELFPALAKKVGALKENKQEATTLDFKERQGWQSWIKENGKRIEAVGEVLKKSVGDEWYKKNKVSVDAGLAFQEGVLKRTEAVLAAKTPKEREVLDKDLVEFRRRASEVPRLVPGQTVASVGAKIEEIKAASKALDTAEQDEGKRKAAQAKKQEEISELRRLLSILALDQDIQNERELHTAISDEQVTAEVQRRREMNAMREPGTERVSESVEDVYKETERVAGEHHEEMRGLVSVGKAMRKLFTESLAQCHPSAEVAKTFSPVYEAWNEEQEASLELVDANRERGFLDHLEVWVTQGLRTLDQNGEETLSEEAWQNMVAEGGEEHEFADLLDPNERNVEAIKARLYDIMRKATQDKIQAQQKRLEVEQRAQKADGITREELEAKRGAVEGAVEKATLELTRLSNTIKTMQAGASKGGNAIRWAREGNTLLEQEKILQHARDSAMEKKADFDELAAILTEKKPEGSSSDEKEAATLPFALQEGVNTRLAALMKKQTERARTTEAARASAVQGIYKANPRMMDVEIKSTSSGKMGGEIKRESIGGGTAPKGAYESFKSSWAGKLMSPFLSVFEGLFK